MSSATETPPSGSRRLFLIVLAFAVFQPLFLIAERRVPLGHETGRLFGLQLSFADSAVPSGIAPRSWMEQGLLLQNAILAAVPVLRGFPFIALFHGGLFLEELLFLVGVWLLGSKYYRSPFSQYVAAVAALGSCLWMDHAAANFLVFSALPLLLYFLHEVLETGARAPLLMAGLLMILQIPGRPPEFALLVPAAAVLYGLGASLVFGYPLRNRLRALSWNRRMTAGTVALLVPGIVVAAGLLAAAEPPGHAPGEAFSPRDLLVTAGIGSPLALLDAGLGFCPSLDVTFFCGYVTLALAAGALGSCGFRTSLRLLGFLLLSLLILALLPPLGGLLLSSAGRPLPVGVPLMRLVVVFLAGAGCDRMIESRSVPRLPARTLLLLSGALAVLVVFNPLEEGVIRRATALLTLGTPAVAVSPLLGRADLFKTLAGSAALMSGLAGGALLLRSSGWRRAPLALALILVLHPLDVFGWKFRMTWLKSCSLSRDRAAAQVLMPPPPRPFPGTEFLQPPVSPGLDRPYGSGATPLRSSGAPATGTGIVDSPTVRAPVQRACQGILGLCSLVLIGWTLRRSILLGGAGGTRPGIA
jgi:hypothetical protein